MCERVRERKRERENTTLYHFVIEVHARSRHHACHPDFGPKSLFFFFKYIFISSPRMSERSHTMHKYVHTRAHTQRQACRLKMTKTMEWRSYDKSH